MTWVSRITLIVLLYTQAASFAGVATSGSALQVAVTDSGNLPIPGVRIEVKLAGNHIASAVTGESGLAAFPDLTPAPYEITASKDGFEPGRLTIADAAQPLHLTLEPAGRHESVKVMSAAAPIDQGSAGSVDLTPQQVKELPSRPATVADALPMIPGVARKPDGGLEISGSPEHRASLIVNSADVTDPATGQFGLTVPIDSVQSVTVYQTPFLAEYGRFTAGLVSVETRRGGDEWKWEINDPFPDFAIRSYHLRGIRDATPRLNAEGPIVRNRLFFSEGLEYEVRKVQVHTLPFPTIRRRMKASIRSSSSIGSSPISSSSRPPLTSLRRKSTTPTWTITIPSPPLRAPARAITRRPSAISGTCSAGCSTTRSRRRGSARIFGARVRRIS